jgi:hypothetical protein
MAPLRAGGTVLTAPGNLRLARPTHFKRTPAGFDRAPFVEAYGAIVEHHVQTDPSHFLCDVPPALLAEALSGATPYMNFTQAFPSTSSGTVVLEVRGGVDGAHGIEQLQTGKQTSKKQQVHEAPNGLVLTAPSAREKHLSVFDLFGVRYTPW